MERKDFLKGSLGFLGMSLLVPAALRSGNTIGTEQTQSCVSANPETAGPFPTINPASLQQSNIVGDRTGVAFTINITVKNVNNACAAQPGVIVDIWHCDKDGYYSEYGGTQMQTVDYTAYHFLRGRQVADANGLVSFTSIFPGWYTSRATHIHVHVYDASGNSILITQIAFPEGTGSAVELVNAATAYGYTQGMSGYTYNASDNVFSDGTSTQMSTITGSVSGGFTLTHDMYISASVTAGLADVEAIAQFQLGQNFPNPVDDQTSVPVILNKNSDVKIELFDMQGRMISEQNYPGLSAGSHNLTIDANALNLQTGLYAYRVQVVNKGGAWQQAKVLTKN